MKPVNLNTKMFHETDDAEKAITLTDYIAKHTKATKLPEGIVKGVAFAAKSGEDFDDDEITDKKVKAAIAKFSIQAKADWKAHEKNKAKSVENAAAAAAEKKKQKEEEKARNEQEKAGAIKVFTGALEDEEIVKTTSQLTEKATEDIAELLSDKFTIEKGGIISVAEDATQDDYAKTLAALVASNQVGGTIIDRSAKFEAQVGFLARKNLGEKWINLLGEREADRSRIVKGIKAFEVCQESPEGLRVFKKLPLSTVRALVEVNISDKQGEDKIKENSAAKQEILAIASERIKSLAQEGKELTQTVAKNLVSEYKASKNIAAKIRYKFFYIFILNDTDLVACGTEELDVDFVRAASIVIDYNANRTRIKDGSLTKTAVPAANAEILAHVEKVKKAYEEAEAAKAPAKKEGKSNKATPAATPAAKKDDDEEEPAPKKKPVVDDDGDEAPAPKKKSPVADDDDDAPAPKKKAPVDDDDDDDLPRSKKTSRAVDLDD